MGCEHVDWIHLAQYMFQYGALENMINEPSGSIIGGEDSE
jgi:hypothetical protein